ncbi:conserved protein of unknown function [Methylococcus capsulatus]|uniref:Tail protein n=1 Tax=Methylococcus capsulatus TaxID=414 RepID=A0AA35XZ10_METCP|nr:hypothetical protein [Methylococcus capsulatus]CAI8742859.1 conserved protein of unknown function [Methylococcus capsulatus]
MILLQEFDYYDGSEKTLYLTYGAGYDNDAGIFYRPAIIQPANYSRDASLLQFGGRTSSSYGETTIANGDGYFDYLNGAYFEGREMRMYTLEDGQPYSSRVLVMRAIIDAVDWKMSEISFRLTDNSKSLDKPLQPNKYGGTNALPNGIDGTPDDIKGQSKPRIYGRISLMGGVEVNTSKLIFQVNDRAVAQIINVFDKGAYLTRDGSTYANQTAMETTAPASGAFKACPSIGCFRTGSTPFGAVSICVAESFVHTEISAAGVIKRVLDDMAISASAYSLQDFADLDGKNCGPVGVIVQDQETAWSVIERIAASVGAWVGFDALNVFRVARLDAPTGSYSVVIDDTVIDSITKPVPAVAPAWKMTLEGDTNYLVQDKNALAGIVPTARAAWFEAATRSASASDTSVKTIRINSQDYTASSVQVSVSQLQAEATRRLNLLKNRLDVVTVTLRDSPTSWLGQVDIGTEVLLQTRWYGYDAGRPMIVTGLRTNFLRNQLDLTLMG